MPGFMPGIHLYRSTSSKTPHISHPSFRDAPLGAGPESIDSMVVMDSGRAASRRTGMTALIFEVVSTLTRNTGIEIDPPRIFVFDQPNFRSRRHFLSSFRARWRA
jgi:hypothetical protein